MYFDRFSWSFPLISVVKEEKIDVESDPENENEEEEQLTRHNETSRRK
jgi:hypothetical protein